MKRPSGPDSLDRARSLGALSTDAEKRLWAYLRNRRLDGAKFRRQVWIGDYVVDFVCIEAGLVIEADGGQHAEAADYDARRSAWLAGEGFRVLRFWNHDVLGNTDGVVRAILHALHTPHPPTRQEAGGALSPPHPPTRQEAGGALSPPHPHPPTRQEAGGALSPPHPPTRQEAGGPLPLPQGERGQARPSPLGGEGGALPQAGRVRGRPPGYQQR
jgi:very-short-patch-repair endonuclease